MLFDVFFLRNMCAKKILHKMLPDAILTQQVKCTQKLKSYKYMHYRKTIYKLYLFVTCLYLYFLIIIILVKLIYFDDPKKIYEEKK